MTDTTRDVAAGALGGLVGGAVLSGATIMAARAGLMDRTDAVRVERWASYRMGGDRERLKRDPDAYEEASAQAGHLVASAALGAAYGALRARYDLPTTATGLAFGLGLFALNHGLIGPALTITKKPWNQKPAVFGARAGLHILFGLVLAAVVEAATRRR